MEASKAAVEAAAKLRHSRSRMDRKWDELMESEREKCRAHERTYLQAALPIERNRWEQEVRERLLELADKFEEEAGPNGPKQCQCCRKANKQLLDLAATFGEAEPVEGAGDKAIHLGRLEGALSIVEGTGEFSREGLAEVLRKSVAGLRGEVEPNEPESDHAKCETCGGREVVHTGECREAMSGPTCFNPACPPCQTPETEPCPDCQGTEG